MDVAVELSMKQTAIERLKNENDESKIMDVILYRRSTSEHSIIQEEDMLVVIPYIIDVDLIKKYINFHKKYSKNAEDKKRKIIMAYDLRKFENPSFEFVSNLAALHEELHPVYETILVCTFIMTNSEFVSNIINLVFTTIYRPIRPVRMLFDKNDAVTFVQGVKSIKEMYSDISNDNVPKSG